MAAASPTETTLMDPVQAQALLREMADKLGREINIFMSSAAIATADASLPGSAPKHEEEPDDFYEFTMEDYARTMANRKEEIFLKTRKVREAEAAARRARVTKAIIRVQFPDNCVVEAKFQPSDSISMLIDFLKKVVSRSDLPFYLYTAPPKQRLEDIGKDLYTSGLTPGALVYFHYNLPPGVTEEKMKEIMDGPYLRSDVMALRDLHLLPEPASDVLKPEEFRTASKEISEVKPVQPVDQRTRKSGMKPKWMKL